MRRPGPKKQFYSYVKVALTPAQHAFLREQAGEDDPVALVVRDLIDAQMRRARKAAR